MAKTQVEMQKELDAYKKSLEGKTLEELRKLEEELMVEADKNDVKIKEAEFDLSSENYETVAEAVRYFLDSQEVAWQYALAMVSMYDFWDPKKKADKIPYPQLDATLRTLGGLKFKGYNEWAMVIAINKYFEPLHESYASLTEPAYEIATKHSYVMDAIQKLTPITQD